MPIMEYMVRGGAMQYKLICDEELDGIIEEYLDRKGFERNNYSYDVVLLQNDLKRSQPHDKISICFNKSNLEEFFSLIDRMNTFTHPKFIIGKKEENFSIINFEDIHYFESKNNTTFCYTESEEYICKEKLYELEQMLMDKDFIRVSKSNIINIMKIKQIIPWFNYKLMLVFQNDEEIIVSKNYIKAFKQSIGM